MNLPIDASGAGFYLSGLIRSFESDCFVAKQKISVAKDMQAVKKCLMDLHIKPELRGHPATRQGKFSVETAAGTRLESMLDGHLKQLRECSSVEEMKQLRGKFIRTEWITLQGNFPKVHHKALTESQRLIGRQEVSARAAPAMLQDATILHGDVGEPADDDQDDSDQPAPGR